MATVGSSLLSSASLTFPQITAETVENVTIALANTEVSHALPAGTRQYKIQYRSNGVLKVAFSVGTSGTTYWELYPGQPAETIFVNSAATITLYLQSAKTGVVEIWSGQ
jgi:hypothetical protein